MTDNTQAVPSMPVFGWNPVLRLTKEDFILGSDNSPGRCPICLKHKDCLMVLFYGRNQESIQLAQLWATAAEQIPGLRFAAVNLFEELEVSQAFTGISDISTLYWARLKGLPFILVYQNGWPKAFYNGERAVQPIVDYALTLACEPGYREPTQLAASEAVTANLEIPGWQEYRGQYKRSTDFTVTNPLRIYPKGAQVVEVGSPLALVQNALVNQVVAQTLAQQAGQSVTGTSPLEQLTNQQAITDNQQSNGQQVAVRDGQLTSQPTPELQSSQLTGTDPLIRQLSNLESGPINLPPTTPNISPTDVTGTLPTSTSLPTTVTGTLPTSTSLPTTVTGTLPTSTTLNDQTIPLPKELSTSANSNQLTNVSPAPTNVDSQALSQLLPLLQGGSGGSVDSQALSQLLPLLQGGSATGALANVLSGGAGTSSALTNILSRTPGGRHLQNLSPEQLQALTSLVNVALPEARGAGQLIQAVAANK